MSALAVAFYGKLVSQADFVRINAGTFAQDGWDAWFQEAVAALQRVNLRLPSQSVRFVLNARARLCAGAFAPGRDALSRTFPAIVSVAAPAPPPAGLTAWRHQHESFFAAAASLALRATQLTTAELTSRLSALGSRVSAPFSQPDAPEILAAAGLSDLRVGLDLADLAYGLTTAISACVEARAAKPGQPSRVLTLHDQASSEVQRSFWIELVSRHLGVSLPSFLWTEQDLVITLGPPPPAALAFLVDPAGAGSRLWPLRTRNPAARAATVAKLSPAQAHVLGSPGASLAHVLSVFSREPL